MSTYLLEVLPPVVGDAGTDISLSTILTDDFGAGWDGYTEFSLAWYDAASLAYWDFHYWDPNDPSVSKWLDNGTPITASNQNSYNVTNVSAADVSDFTLQLGNDIAPYVYLTVPIGNDSFIQYEINVVAQGLQAPPSGVDGEPTPQDIVASAIRYDAAYDGVVNPNDCGFMASDLAAAAGAPLDDQVSESLDPAENSSFGFWRVVYRGSDPNPVSNWQSLLQPGDIVRMGWTGGGQHTTTVLTINSDGSITVFDNENTVGNGPSFMSIHTVNYDTETIPTKITIFRLTTDHLYLIDGSAGGQILNGTPQYDNEIITSGETQTVNCGPHSDVVEITSASTGTMTINGGGGQDTVVYTDLGVEGAAFFDPNGQPLTIVNGTIHTGEPVTVVWLDGSDTLNGISSIQFTDATIDITPCYCPGTLIKTPRGETAVEKLKIGDKVMTMSGAARPIKWIGRRSYRGRFLRGRKEILPVCIKAGALADNVPRRDLWISPHHAMYLDGVLIEARDLINSVSIVQAAHVEHVEYFHIELDTHDVISAEGALAESFIDDDSRGMFHNAHEYGALYADEIQEPVRYCAPRLDEGYEVEAVRVRLAQRAGLAVGRARR
jgi:Hint domain